MHEQVLENSKLLLKKAQKHYEKQVNAGKYEVEYEVGQKMLLKVKNFTMPKCLIPKFMTKFASPLPIMKQVFKDVYKLELTPDIKVHLTFHVSLLKQYKTNTLWPDCNQMIIRPLKFVGDHLEYEAKGILMRTW